MTWKKQNQLTDKCRIDRSRREELDTSSDGQVEPDGDEEAEKKRQGRGGIEQEKEDKISSLVEE